MTTMTTAPTTTARNPRRQALLPVIVDVAVPLGGYYLLSKGFGLGPVAALGLSSVVPLLRVGWGVVQDRRINPVALLMLGVNIAGLLLSFVTGDPRLMLAKDSGVSSVIGLSVLISAVLGRPLMSVVLKPWITKGDPAKVAACEQLAATSVKYRRAERLASIIWGGAMFAECVTRVVGVYTLPIDTMVWLGPVILIAALVLAMRVSVPLAIKPMAVMVAEAARRA